MKIGIIGSGKFGLVLARIAAENKNEVFIYLENHIIFNLN